MRIDQQPAYLLHTRPWRETSLLLEAFTRAHGRIGLVARGVRRERSRLPRGVLQPLQPLLIGWVARGELGTLTSAEAASAPLRMAGDALLAAMYVNELVLRLVGRSDPHAEAFGAYAQCLARLAGGEHVAWTLRRFERDLFAALGYALGQGHDAAGGRIDPRARYAFDPGAGLVPTTGRAPAEAVSGAALIALGRDEQPDAADLAQLRRFARAIVRHLAGGELNAWSMSPAALRSRPG
jgi:DNA repair protein RecO (recombination protein O)